MRRFFFCSLTALALGAALSIGCTQDFSTFEAYGAGVTGAGGASSTSSGSTTGVGTTAATLTGGGGCTSDTSCDDNNPCTTDRCVANGCSHTNQDGPAPDDGNVCTTEICSGGVVTRGYAPKGTSCGSRLKCDGMSMCVACTIDQECMTSGECKVAYCVDHACVPKPAPVGTHCSGGVCAMNGACVECVSNTQCMLGSVCQNDTCVDMCHNGKRDILEADVDCGNKLSGCDPCAGGKKCLTGADCLSGSCKGGVCGHGPTCMDAMLNGTETDVDCGGPTCPQCAKGQKCKVDADCETGKCKNGQNFCE
jgi:hypothetical protein